VTSLDARAEPPTGSYVIPVGGEHGIFLPGAITSQECEADGDVTVCTSGVLAADASGEIAGSSVAELSGAADGQFDAVYSGTLRGSPASWIQLGLAMTLAGDVSIDGELLEVESRGRWLCFGQKTIDGVRCLGGVRRCVSASGEQGNCESARSVLNLADRGGPWALYLELATDEAGIVSGTGSVFLPTGPEFSYALHGSYDTSTDTATLQLSGIGDAQGSELELEAVSLSGETATAGELRWRIAGQSGRTDLPAPEPFPGHGQCFRGGFCDTNADTATFFGGANPQQFVFDDTIFFGILGAASRSQPLAPAP